MTIARGGLVHIHGPVLVDEGPDACLLFEMSPKCPLICATVATVSPWKEKPSPTALTLPEVSLRTE